MTVAPLLKTNQQMKNAIGIIIAIVVFLLGRKAYGMYTKYRNSKALKFDIAKVEIANETKLHDLISEVKITVHQQVKNFSSSTFNVEQINIDVFSTKEELIAEQDKPLTQAEVIPANDIKTILLDYTISILNMRKLVKEAGGAIKVSANYLTSGKYGIPIKLKGTVTVEGVLLDIDQQITI